MEKTKDILDEVEMMLLQAEIRISLINTITVNPSDEKFEELQFELEKLQVLVVRLENSLIKKINQALKIKIRSTNSQVA